MLLCLPSCLRPYLLSCQPLRPLFRRLFRQLSGPLFGLVFVQPLGLLLGQLFSVSA
ncbi:hypothetical protein OG440_24155 [Streptomyces sp. NBC_00637]|uniref:hypothetical protein n=1 Tax=Streptomyces sp. NBC_00637 TaxID=2903667 RepID=UPI0032507A7D